jgi:condensin complex subunit 3
MGITHPRVLSIAQRELIIRNGVGDREPAVKTAAAALLGTWIDVIGEGDEGQEDNLNVETRVVQLLKLLDLVDSKIAEDALLNVFESRVDVFDNLEFGGGSDSL